MSWSSWQMLLFQMCCYCCRWSNRRPLPWMHFAWIAPENYRFAFLWNLKGFPLSDCHPIIATAHHTNTCKKPPNYIIIHCDCTWRIARTLESQRHQNQSRNRKLLKNLNWNFTLRECACTDLEKAVPHTQQRKNKNAQTTNCRGKSLGTQQTTQLTSFALCLHFTDVSWIFLRLSTRARVESRAKWVY